MPLWRLHDLQKAVAQKPAGENIDITGVSIDSRTIKKGELFVALKDLRDGHDFVEKAVASGAKAVLVERKFAGLQVPQIVVLDTLKAIEQVATLARQRFAGKVIAITGSCGKTTTKDFLATALQAHAPVESFNNQWGVPLTLARMPANKKFAVIEIGTNSVGEIAPLAKLVKPHVAIILNIKPVHLAGFKNLEELKKEKYSIAEGLLKNGQLITPNHFGANDFTGKIIQPTPARIACASAAQAVAKAVGFDMDLFHQRIAKVEVPKGRGNIIKINGITIIDDSYNANPASVTASLQALKAMEGKRKFAILGDMLELGSNGEKYHAELAKHCTGLNGVICVGELMRNLYDSLPKNISKNWAKNTSKLDPTTIIEQFATGDIILVKGSKKIFWAKDFVKKLKELLQ